jgi:hypothetical protein
MKVEVNPVMRVTELICDKVEQDSEDPRKVRVFCRAKVEPTGLFDIVITNETAVVTPETKTETAEKIPAGSTETPEDADPRPIHGGAKPPEDGLCRNCKMRRRLNRFKLCYPCWVEAEIIDREKREGREWKPGDPHPEWCHCEGLGEHKSASGASRGNN